MKTFPALAAVREDGFTPGPWTVQEGSTQRGNASCDLTNRVLEVPTDSGDVARVVRAHELTHARVSPVSDVLIAALESGVAGRALECAEEARVNFLAGQAGFDIGLLVDGTEKDGGTRIGEQNNWSEAICFLAATLGTGAFKPYLAGIRKSQPTWVAPMRAIAKRMTAILTSSPTNVVASTSCDDEGTPLGFSRVTLPMATMISQSMQAAVPQNPEQLRAFKRSLESGGRRPATGRFAELLWLDQPEFARSDLRGSIRKSRPASSGTSLRYPSRLLTDPHKRAMSRQARADGGIVLIDQSGSMDIEDEAVHAFARQHPRALLVGYSHRPGDQGTQANVWILAANGKVTTSVIPANIGNGVDGPILHWALKQRRGSEPLVWVCDGQVTDSHDHPGEHLTAECAELVAKNRIQMVRDLSDVANALLHPRALRLSEFSEFGRTGRALTDRRG